MIWCYDFKEYKKTYACAKHFKPIQKSIYGQNCSGFNYDYQANLLIDIILVIMLRNCINLNNHTVVFTKKKEGLLCFKKMF